MGLNEFKIAFNMMFDPWKRRIMNMIGRGVLAALQVENSRQKISATLTNGEDVDDLEHPMEYGFVSKALPGAEIFFACAGGNRDHIIVICVGDKRYEIPVDDGEVALYTHDGSTIHMKNGGIGELKFATKMLFDAPLAEFTGKITAADNIESDAEIKADAAGAGVTLTGHDHNETGVVTNPPNPGT